MDQTQDVSGAQTIAFRVLIARNTALVAQSTQMVIFPGTVLSMDGGLMLVKMQPVKPGYINMEISQGGRLRFLLGTTTTTALWHKEQEGTMRVP
jgi:hypothetical protein